MFSGRSFRWASEILEEDRTITAANYPESTTPTVPFVDGFSANDTEHTAIASGKRENLNALAATERD